MINKSYIYILVYKLKRSMLYKYSDKNSRQSPLYVFLLIVPSSFLMLQDSFFYYFLYVWRSSFVQFLNVGLLFINSFISFV